MKPFAATAALVLLATACGNGEPEPGISDSINQIWDNGTGQQRLTICIELEPADADPLAVIGDIWEGSTIVLADGAGYENNAANRQYIADRILELAERDC